MLELLEVIDKPPRLRVVPVELEPELARLRKHVASARQLGDEDPRLVANERGVDVLVRVLVLEHRSDVLPALVRERTLSHVRLLQRQRQVGDLRHGA